MKKLIRNLCLSLSLLWTTAWAEVVQVEYQDNKGVPAAKYASPYYINPQSSLSAAVTAGVGRHIVLEVKNTKGDLVFTQSKNRVENKDTFVVNGVTYFGAKFDVTKLVDGQYSLTSIVYSTAGEEVSRQENDLFIDTQAPLIVGDFYWNPFGSYAHKHTDGRFIVSRAGASDAGYPSISVGASGFSHATFSSEFLDGPKKGAFHAKDIPAVLTAQGKLIIGTGAPNSMLSVQIPNDTANQMRLTYTVYNKVGISVSRSVDVYVATLRGQKPEPYAIYTGAATKINDVNAFTGFVPYVAKMTIPSNPVRMIYRAPKDLYIGGGGSADIYGGWLNGPRGPNQVVHTDAQYIYFDVTGSTDGKQYSALHLYTRDMSTWRTHLLTHDVTIPTGMEPPKPMEHSFYIEGLKEWRNSNTIQYITKSDTGGTNDVISKIKVVVEPRLYDQRFAYDYSYIDSSYKGFCIIPAGDTECLMSTSLPYPANDVHHYSQRSAVTNLANTLYGPELQSTWQYDGAIAEVDPKSVLNDPISKTVSFSFINTFSDRLAGGSAIRVLDAFALNSKGVKTKLPQSHYIARALNASDQLVSGTYQYSSLPDGIYDIEAYVEDGFGFGGITNKNTHKLFSGISIDNSIPKITTNILSQTVVSLPGVSINVSDSSFVSIKSVVLTGGIDNVNIALPMVTTGSNSFRPDHVYIRNSKTHLYTITIVAEDAFGNRASKIETFHYVPNIVELPDIKQPAIASPLKSASGMPSNVIQTPQVKNKLGELAQGNHEALFTVLPTATSGMFINGQLISPGETKQFTVNLSQTNHRLTFEAYPAVSGQALTNQFEINLPDVRVSLCPATFELKSDQCISISFLPPDLKCNSPFTLNGSICEARVSYNPSTECLDGYTLSGTTCKGVYSASPIQNCPNDYSIADANTCEKVQTKALKVCPEGQTIVDSFCKNKDGVTTPQKAYCDGIDVSGGSFCDGGKCYTYKPDWNACQISEKLPTIATCQVGSFVAGSCQVSDEYDLNMQCPFGFNRDGILCKRIEIIDPIKSCEPGFTLVGSTCSKTEVSSYTACPSTHYLLNGRCHATASTTINCPANYSWNGTDCEKNDQKPALPVCDVDHAFNGTVCQKDDFLLATPVCPVDYVVEGAKCSNKKITGATPICPAGYSWNIAKEICEEPQEIPAIKNCPLGYSLDGSSCKKPEDLPATGSCTASDIALGYSWNGTQCTKTENQSAEINCPPDKPWNGTTCEKINKQPAELNCPVNFTWDGTQCAKPDSTAATINCPSGHTWNGTSCEKNESISATGSCSASSVSAGFSWNGSSCTKNDYQGATPSCSSGYSWNGSSCTKDESQGATPSCSSGYSWNGSNCAKNESQGATPSCSAGFTWNGSTCTKTESLSASPSCVAGFTWDGSSCSKNESQGATQSCATGFTWNGSTCTKNETQGATPTCASGFTWNGSDCAKNESQRATDSRSCPELRRQMCGPSRWTVAIEVSMGKSVCTYTDHEHCGSWSTTAPIEVKYSCQSGWTLSGSTCNRSLTQAPTYSCQSGWTLSGSTCNRSATQAPTYSCPSGWTVSGSTCNRSTTQAPAYSCPSGWTVSGSSCNRSATQAPTYSCPSGWTVSGSTCNRTSTQSPTYSCPSGWAVSGSTCNRTSTRSPTYSCPSGWTVSGSDCSRTLFGSTTYSCPSSGGWSLSGNQCNRVLNATPTYSCPPTGGWSLVGTSCERTLTQPQSYVCPASGGWVIQGSECKQSLTQLPVYTCPNAGGWQVQGNNCSRNLLTPTTYQCPQEGGWVLDKDLCNRILVEVPTHSCPPDAGWVLNSDMCNRTSSLAPDSYECPVGQILDGITCTATTIKDPDSYQCLPGWINELDKCRLTTTKPVSNYQCDPEWTLDEKICRILLKSSETRTCPITHTKIDENRCHLKTPATSVGECQDGWTSNLTHCILRTTKPADLSCLPSYELQSSQCHTTITQPVTVECQPDEAFEGGKCVVIRNHAPVPLCSSPYLLENPTSCKNEIVIPKFQ